MQIQALLQRTGRRLAEAGIPEADIEAGLLLGHFLRHSRARLHLHAKEEVSDTAVQKIEAALLRRLAREPLAYITGEQEFWSLAFRVSPAVLIPRPETEQLVENALQRARELDGSSLSILDLGVGSGVIAIVLALELPRAHVVALDKSAAALEIAARNAKRHGVSDRVCLLRSDWLRGVRPSPVFDLVTANPPYVARETMQGLQPEVRLFEPRTALDGGPQGLEDIAFLSRELHAVIRPGGWIFMEIGAEQGLAVSNLFASSGKYDRVEIHNDLAGLPRIMQARRRANP